MLELNKSHFRVLYLIAKAGEPVLKSTISHGTARWNARERDAVLRDLELAPQQIASKAGRPRNKEAVRYYWLTPAGIETVDNLEAAGKIKRLPANWRENYQ